MEPPHADITTGETAAAPNRSAGSGAILKPCANCRRRKVRCDKATPCANCVRSGIRCLYEGAARNEETGLFRDAAAAAELRDRIFRLEALIENVASINLRDPTGSQRPEMKTDTPASGLLTAPRSENEEVIQSTGRQVFDANASHHIDPSAWSEFYERVENVKFWLIHSNPQASPMVPASSAFVYSLGTDAPPPDVKLYPAIQQSELICKIFWRIVEPFIKILHRPAFATELEQYRRQSSASQTEFEALLFVIHALTIAVLPPDVVAQTFNNSKDSLLTKFQLEAEKALARADVLKSRSIWAFQAFVYYVTLLYERGHYDDASTQSGLALRIAQRLGIQYDPHHASFSPWVAEMRRRMWTYTMQLDLRALSLCAFESSIPLSSSWDTKPPKNLNDDHWDPCMFSGYGSEPPSEDGFRETTFVLARRNFFYLYRRMSQTNVEFETMQQSILRHRSTFQEMRSQHFKSDHPLHQLVAALVEQQFSYLDIVSRSMHLKRHVDTTRPGSPTNIHPTSTPEQNTFQHALFLSCLAHLEETSHMESLYSRYKWQWIIRDPVPWHAVARVLTDLCHWFDGPDIDRAWIEIDRVWDRYGKDNGNLVGSPIWMPLTAMRDQAEFRLKKFKEGNETSSEERISKTKSASEHGTKSAGMPAVRAGRGSGSRRGSQRGGAGAATRTSSHSDRRTSLRSVPPTLHAHSLSVSAPMDPSDLFTSANDPSTSMTMSDFPMEDLTSLVGVGNLPTTGSDAPSYFDIFSSSPPIQSGLVTNFDDDILSMDFGDIADSEIGTGQGPGPGGGDGGNRGLSGGSEHHST